VHSPPPTACAYDGEEVAGALLLDHVSMELLHDSLVDRVDLLVESTAFDTTSDDEDVLSAAAAAKDDIFVWR